MDRRRTFELLLLVGILGTAGCTSDVSESSYELVEAPKTATVTPPAEQPPVADTSPAAAPVAATAEQAVAPSPLPEAASPVSSPGSTPEQNASEAANALVENPVPTAALQIASLRRDAANPEMAAALEPLKAAPDSIKDLAPNKIELKVPHKEFERVGKEKALRISYDDIDLLKILNMEPVPLDAETYLPGWLKALHGETVVLRGWMFPPLMTEGLPAFLFVRDNQICCFGREAKVYDKLRVTLKEGTTTDYIFGRPFDVIGTFRIESEERDGELYFLYSIDDAVVKK